MIELARTVAVACTANLPGDLYGWLLVQLIGLIFTFPLALANRKPALSVIVMLVVPFRVPVMRPAM